MLEIAALAEIVLSTRLGEMGKGVAYLQRTSQSGESTDEVIELLGRSECQSDEKVSEVYRKRCEESEERALKVCQYDE